MNVLIVEGSVKYELEFISNVSVKVLAILPEAHSEESQR